MGWCRIRGRRPGRIVAGWKGNLPWSALLGTGIGTGIVLSGKVMTAAGAGELGHTPVAESRRPRLRKNGCLVRGRRAGHPRN
ncbi:MAG: ROK family protein [Christensenellaceae bacterium]